MWTMTCRRIARKVFWLNLTSAPERTANGELLAVGLTVRWKSNFQIRAETYKTCGDSEIELELEKNTLLIRNLPDWTDKVDFCRWHTMNDFFAQNVDYAKEWKENLVSLIKENLAQVFHPTKVILLKDSSSYEHETLGGENLEEEGGTIEEALACNSTFEQPCAVLKNDEAFGHSKDLRQPIYVFDL